MRRWALISMVAVVSCSETENRPLATDRNAEIAAQDCDIHEWHWAQVFAFDAPQPEEPYFGYELESLPTEEIEAERGRSWDRTERIDAINACLHASFQAQGVRAGLAAPALVETVIEQEDLLKVAPNNAQTH